MSFCWLCHAPAEMNFRGTGKEKYEPSNFLVYEMWDEIQLILKKFALSVYNCLDILLGPLIKYCHYDFMNNTSVTPMSCLWTIWSLIRGSFLDKNLQMYLLSLLLFKFLDSVIIDERFLSTQHTWVLNKCKSRSPSNPHVARRYIQTQVSAFGRMNHTFENFLDMIIRT